MEVIGVLKGVFLFSFYLMIDNERGRKYKRKIRIEEKGGMFYRLAGEMLNKMPVANHHSVLRSHDSANQ